MKQFCTRKGNFLQKSLCLRLWKVGRSTLQSLPIVTFHPKLASVLSNLMKEIDVLSFILNHTFKVSFLKIWQSYFEKTRLLYKKKTAFCINKVEFLFYLHKEYTFTYLKYYKLLNIGWGLISAETSFLVGIYLGGPISGWT